MSKKSQQSLGLGDSKATGPVECLGRTFPSDAARRDYYLKLLAEKLKDPEFRRLPGFPKGTDNEILHLSDPPYYTACPNPFLSDFVKYHAAPATAADTYRREPFAIDVSVGKSGGLYNAHTYHTKVPPFAIAQYLLWYTSPGDTILDTYAGSGMTGVAALLCGFLSPAEKETIVAEWRALGRGLPQWGARRAILGDLSPAASFIARNHVAAQDRAAVLNELETAATSVHEALGWSWATRHNGWRAGERDPKKWKNRSSDEGTGEIVLVIWSEAFVCRECAGEIVLWDSAVDPVAADIADPVCCPHCQAENAKAALDRAVETYYDGMLQEVRSRNKFVPVWLLYRVGTERFEKVPDPRDLETIRETREKSARAGVVTRMMDASADGPWGAMYRAGYHRGVTHVHHFYTERVWASIASLWDQLTLPGARFTLTSLMGRLSRMHALHLGKFFKGGGGFAAGPRKGQLYFPSLALELNPFEFLNERAQSASKTFWPASAQGSVLTTVGSAEQILLEDDSVDYVFVDPPFGQNIIYSELNFLWEAWLGVRTEVAHEAIVDDYRDKTMLDYQRKMEGGFAELYRVLKPGRWMTVVFHNSRNDVWVAIQEALQRARFVVADVRVLDKKQGSQKQVVAPGTVRSDLAITAYKPATGLSEAFELKGGTPAAVWSFVSNHLRHLPVFVGSGGVGDVLPERQAHLLYDRMVAFHVQRGVAVPLPASEFYAGLRERYVPREGMFFLPEQTAEYDRKRTAVGELRQLELFISDEASATQWLRQQLDRKPQTFQELQPQFMQHLLAWATHEKTIELKEILALNFLSYDGSGPVPSQIHSYLSTNFKDLRNLGKDAPGLKAKARDRWYVPDPSKEADLEKLRLRTLLKEFEDYRAWTGRKLKQFRTEAVRAGFKHSYDGQDYQTIVDVAAKLPEQVIQEDEKLLMYFDVATMRLGKE